MIKVHPSPALIGAKEEQSRNYMFKQYYAGNHTVFFMDACKLR